MSYAQSGKVLEYKIGNMKDNNFYGNTFIVPDYNAFQAYLPVQQEVKPYGFWGYPVTDTPFLDFDDLVTGYIDHRIPYNFEQVEEAGCSIYSNNSSVVVNPSEIIYRSAVKTENFDDPEVQYTNASITPTRVTQEVVDTDSGDSGNVSLDKSTYTLTISSSAGQSSLNSTDDNLTAEVVAQGSGGNSILELGQDIASLTSTAGVELSSLGLQFNTGVQTDFLSKFTELSTVLTNILNMIDEVNSRIGGSPSTNIPNQVSTNIGLLPTIATSL